MEYYVVLFIYNSIEYYCLWYTDDIDGFLLENKKLITFSDLFTLYNFGDKHNISVNCDDIMKYNIDEVEIWCKSNHTEVHCENILNLWNIFSDLSTSLRQDFLGMQKTIINSNLYEKLFCGNNLQSIKTSSQIYKPNWSDSEIIELKNIMLNGIELFQCILNCYIYLK